MSLYNLFGLKVHNASEAAFATEEGSFSGRDVACVNYPTVNAIQAAIENPTIRTSIYHENDYILGLKNTSKLGFQTWLRGTSTSAGNATAALGSADLAEGQLFENALGGESLGTGTTVGTGSTTTNIVLASSAGFSVGQAVLIGTEASVIATVPDGTHITLVRALTSAPSNSTVCYASATYYCSQSISSTLQFQARGTEDDFFKLYGCQGTLTFADLNPGQLPKCAWDFHVANWDKADSSSLAAPSFDQSNTPPVIGSAGKLWIQDVGTTTINIVDSPSIAFVPGVDVQPWPSVSGTQGLQGWARSVVNPTFTLTVEYSDDWKTKYLAQTNVYAHYQIGTTAGATVLIEIQNAALSAMPGRVNIAGQLMSTITGRGLRGTTTTNDLTKSPFRIHLL